MLLYHTSDREISNPDIHFGRKNADFGWGFYLTPDRDFTYRWARKNAVVNIFELDLDGLEVHSFERNTDWFRYIFHNRRLRDGLTADVIIGPIANDTIFDTFGLITSGYLKDEDALKLLLIGPEYTQVAIKTPKAAAQMKWLGAERIDRVKESVLAAEKEAYQELFSAEIDKLLEGE